ncbi:aryl-sulfate sulfotransferase [Brachyspira murdochii]|uniref:aryl-sulfate sulfotransferase n=1 Tax=Brachyspira murdochii TaxID=84378 RepID=UPI0030064367
MKKLLSIILLITSILSLSCNHNKLNSSLTSSIGKVGEITVNPLGVTPLSAVYTTETVNAAPITVTVKGLYGEPDIIHTYPAGYGTEFEIHGMFPESQNVIEVNDGGRIITKNVPVGALQNGIQKKYDVVINNLPEEKYENNPNFYFISYNAGSESIGISRNGYIRYFNTFPAGYMSKIIINNKKLNIVKLTEYQKDVSAISDFVGNRIKTLPEIAHHDLIIIKNNYVHLGNSSWGGEDSLIELSYSGNIIKHKNFGTLIKDVVLLNNDASEIATLNKIVFDENNKYINKSGMQEATDWFHANSLVYDSSTDILYVSSRHRGVLAIDYSDWKLIWWMADDTLQTSTSDSYLNGSMSPYQVYFKDLPSLLPYRVKGAGLDDGPKNQHALFLLANGNLGMFDNQGDENTNPNGSRYVEYKITGSFGNYMAQKVYEYRDSSLYSRIMSDVDFTGENYENLLLCYAYPTARILEIEKNTKNVLFRLDLPFMTYRADKMPLYYDEGRVYSEDCNLKNPN